MQLRECKQRRKQESKSANSKNPSKEGSKGAKQQISRMHTTKKAGMHTSNLKEDGKI